MGFIGTRRTHNLYNRHGRQSRKQCAGKIGNGLKLTFRGGRNYLYSERPSAAKK